MPPGPYPGGLVVRQTYNRESYAGLLRIWKTVKKTVVLHKHFHVDLYVDLVHSRPKCKKNLIPR